MLSSEFQKIIDEPISLPIPLSEFPEETEDFIGHDHEIPAVTRENTEENFTDDYLNIRYVNKNTNNGFGLYIVFCSSKSSGLLGHRPRICYKGNGWIHDETKPLELKTEQNRQIPCLIHHFHKPFPDNNNKIVVLNYYVVNSQITNDEDEFSSIWGRRPNISGDIARYVAQVQISSNVESSVIAAAESISDKILQLLPNPKNKVSATAEK